MFGSQDPSASAQFGQQQQSAGVPTSSLGPSSYGVPSYGAPVVGASPYSSFVPSSDGFPSQRQHQQHQPEQQGYASVPQYQGYGAGLLQHQGYAPQQHGFSVPPQQQQGYAAGTPSFPAGMNQQQQYGSFMPSAPPMTQAGDPGFGMPTISPMAFMAGSSLLSGGHHWGQSLVQKMQQRTGWLRGGILNFYFNISRAYVLSKLLMLLAPYLRRWTYSRQPEQIQGGQKYRPPVADVNSPDLYIPLVGLWTYAMLVCVVHASKGTFKPDLMYSTLWSACLAWGVHLLVARVVLRALGLPTGISWVELAAYTGYAFVPSCMSIVAGFAGGAVWRASMASLAAFVVKSLPVAFSVDCDPNWLLGKWGYWGAYGYCSLCMAIFMVRTMKRIIFQEAGHYGHDMSLSNYLLLTLAMFQFPYIFWLGLRP